jgi:hypothetical protein
VKREERGHPETNEDAPVEPTDRALERELNPMRRFKMIFTTVVVLTVLALILNVLLALIGRNAEPVQTAAETCSTTYKMGFGAIVALLGSRTP